MTKQKSPKKQASPGAIRCLIQQEKLIEALEMAQGLEVVGVHHLAIKQAWIAYTKPEFYLKQNKNPESILIKGIGSLRVLYGKM